MSQIVKFKFRFGDFRLYSYELSKADYFVRQNKSALVPMCLTLPCRVVAGLKKNFTFSDIKTHLLLFPRSKRGLQSLSHLLVSTRRQRWDLRRNVWNTKENSMLVFPFSVSAATFMSSMCQCSTDFHDLTPHFHGAIIILIIFYGVLDKINDKSMWS